MLCIIIHKVADKGVIAQNYAYILCNKSRIEETKNANLWLLPKDAEIIIDHREK